MRTHHITDIFQVNLGQIMLLNTNVCLKHISKKIHNHLSSKEWNSFVRIDSNEYIANICLKQSSVN